MSKLLKKTKGKMLDSKTAWIKVDKNGVLVINNRFTH